MIWSGKQIASIIWRTLQLKMKLWLISEILSVINLQEFWMTKDVNLSEFYSSFIFFTSLMSFLNDTLLTLFMLIILQKLLIQNDHHLLDKETLCWNWLSSTMKIRQSGHLKRSWIYDIQNQTIIFSTKFADLTVILILPGIMQMAMSFKTCLKFYMNIIHDTLTSQIHSLLN